MVKVINNYTLIQRIGSGEFGQVYRAIHAHKPGQFAVKVISVEKVQDNQKLETCTVNQVQTLQAVGHCPHIVHFQENFQTKNNYYFVYEYCDGGTLLEAIRKQGSFTESKALKVIRQLLQAFKILNRSCIMHRDLKPENILLKEGKVKLGDFGFSKQLKQGQNMAKTMLGSPIYMAPQVLKGETYTTKADIWSLGVVLYEMLFGVCPFQSSSIASLISQIGSNEVSIPSSPVVSDRTKTMMRKMLTKDYFRRVSWIELFSYKIDQDGQHIENQQPTSLSGFTSNKSFSLKENEEKAGQVLPPPPNDIKKFYSEKYMNAMTQPIHSETPTTHKALSPTAEATRDHQADDELDRIQGAISSSKRARLIHSHQECLQQMKSALKLLKTEGVGQLGHSLAQLSKVHMSLKEMYEEIKVPAETELLDVASLINIEIIQIDRQMIDMKQQMLRRKLPIPRDGRSRSPSPDTTPFHYS